MLLAHILVYHEVYHLEGPSMFPVHFATKVAKVLWSVRPQISVTDVMKISPRMYKTAVPCHGGEGESHK